jgi:hypothetical protein
MAAHQVLPSSLFPIVLFSRLKMSVAISVNAKIYHLMMKMKKTSLPRYTPHKLSMSI